MPMQAYGMGPTAQLIIMKLPSKFLPTYELNVAETGTIQ